MSTFLELQTDVFRRLEESSSSPQFWNLSDVKGAINAGYEEISETTEWYETSQNVTMGVAGGANILPASGAGAVYYDLNALLSRPPLRVTYVWNPNTSQWLIPTTTLELDRDNRLWELALGEPQRFMMRGLWWLTTYPRRATGVVKVYSTSVPPLLSADGDVPGFDAEYHSALADWAVYDLKCLEGEDQVAQSFLNDYFVKEEQLRRYVQERATQDHLGGFLGDSSE